MYVFLKQIKNRRNVFLKHQVNSFWYFLTGFKTQMYSEGKSDNLSFKQYLCKLGSSILQNKREKNKIKAITFDQTTQIKNK